MHVPSIECSTISDPPVETVSVASHADVMYEVSPLTRHQAQVLPTLHRVFTLSLIFCVSSDNSSLSMCSAARAVVA